MTDKERDQGNADDYDVLSDLGWTHSRALGAWLARYGPSRVPRRTP